MASGDKTVFEDAGSGQLLVKALSSFALELYKEQVKDKSSGNAFMSPLSISVVLNMALLGSRGKTFAEMKTALFLEPLKDESKLHQSFSDLISHLKGPSTRRPRFQLHMANRIYGEQSYKILDEFQTSCKKYYDAGQLPVDFINEPEKAAEEINSWVLEQTYEKIKNIISPDFIDATTRLILINAIYFKSAWQDPFEKEETKEEDFFISPTETLRVKMMYRWIEDASYYKSSDLLCQVLKLFYLDGALSMFILLPDKTSTLEAVEERLTSDHLESIDNGFIRDRDRDPDPDRDRDPDPGRSFGLGLRLGQRYRELDVKLWLPKFRIEETLELTKVLCRMGMKSLFEAGSADLSGIDGTRSLYASKVVHKAFVDVNEYGTEAAAAFAIHCQNYCMRYPEVVKFRADRPFLFFIREERTKAVLFLGRVVRPEQD